MPFLTQAQADVLREIAAMHVPAFYPTDLYPARNNVDNGKRRCLDALVKKGLLMQRATDHRLVLTAFGRAEITARAQRPKSGSQGDSAHTPKGGDDA